MDSAFSAHGCRGLRKAFAGRLLTWTQDMAPFLTDWRGQWTGRAVAVAQPDTGPAAAAVVRWCHAHRVPVVARGREAIRDCREGPRRMHRVQHWRSRSRAATGVCRVDAMNNTIEVEASASWPHVQEAARAVGRLFPLSLAAEGSCTIGGNLATNVGVVQVLRYGNARDLCLGLEVITPSGDLWDGLRALRKDNTGDDLRGLCIESEGTLGVITAAVHKPYPLPAAQLAAFVAVPDPSAAVAPLAQTGLGTGLPAFEWMSDTCVDLVEKHIPGARLPLSTRTPWYGLIEVSDMQSEARASAAVEALPESALRQDLASDAALSARLARLQALCALGENISEAQSAEGPTIKHDISLPIPRIAGFVAATDAAIAHAWPDQRLVVFGHLGDGNLLCNVSPSTDRTGTAHAVAFIALEAPINRLVHDAVVAHVGSISAEHGLECCGATNRRATSRRSRCSSCAPSRQRWIR